VKEFKLVYEDISSIEDVVNRELKQGYELRGNIIIDGDRDFVQVLTRDKEPKETL
jgi:hypothetical protein